MLLLQKRPTDTCSKFLMSRDANSLHQSDENTLSSLMSIGNTNGFRSLRTFDVSNLSRGHLLLYFVVVTIVYSANY